MDSLAWLTQQTSALRPAWTLMHVAVMAWGLMMMVQSRQPAWVEQAGRSVWARVRPLVGAPGGVMAAGVLWALMPCGLLYSALLVAALSGGPLEGALTMALFAVGSGVWLVNDDPNPGNPTDPTSFGSIIDASGETGGQIQIQSTGQVLGLGLSRIFADGENGSGGQVSIAAVQDVLLQGDVSASSKIGAGGNAGAVAAGFLLKGMADTQATLSVLGALVGLSAICAIAVRFSPEHKAREQALYDNTLAAAGNA